MNKQKHLMLASALTSALLLSAPGAFAAGQPPAQEETQNQQQEQIYGSQLMTQQERTEHRARMRAASTAAEREQIRKEHHEQMQKRASERGVTLPAEPPARGGGMGPGGGGMGPGGGGRMGQGSGAMGPGGGGRMGQGSGAMGPGGGGMGPGGMHGQPPAQQDAQTQQQEQIYGSQLMTQQERTEYRARMRGASTAAEREQIRKEHHEQMQKRATERGMTLPAEPPARGGGMGPGGAGTESGGSGG